MPNADPIPGFLSHLPTRKGYPIPRFVGRNDDGEYDFRIVDLGKMQRMCERKRCGICGRKIDFYSWFVTGPVGLQNRVVSDPPMHERCATYALQTCPHLVHQRAERRHTSDVESATFHDDLDVAKEDVLVAICAKSYQHRYSKEHKRIFVRFVPVEAHAYVYQEDGTLTDEPVEVVSK